MPSQRHPVARRRRPITVVLVDDEQLIRIALGQMLIADGVELVGEAANAEDAIELVLDLRPTSCSPASPGVHAIERLGLLAPASHVLVLTRSQENRVVEAILGSASDHILTSAPPEAIIAAVGATAAGEGWTTAARGPAHSPGRGPR